MALTQTQVSKLYVAIFNRASEGNGNAWWQTNYDDMTAAANAMLNSADAQEYFGDSLESNQEFIEHIYFNTFNKTVDDDAEGIAFWVGLLDDGASRGQVVTSLVNAVEAYGPDGDKYDPDDDVTNAAYNQFMNRVAVSDYMAENVENTPENYKEATGFDSDLPVTDDPATVASAKAIIDELAEDDEPPVPVEPGETFWLTGLKDYNNPETRMLEGTDKDDVFKAYLDVNLMGNDVNSLTSADSLDGDDGRDQLWANLIQGTSNMMTMPRPIEPNTQGIEELYFNARETVNESQFVTIAEWIAGGFGAEEFIPRVQLNEVSIAAGNMLDVDYIESYKSDANLIVYGLTTDKSTAGSTPLPEMTVSMDHTSGSTGFTQSLLSGGHLEEDKWVEDYDLGKLGDYYNYYINGQLRASSMKVLFEQNDLVPDVDPGIEGVTFRIMNQDAHDATVGDEGGPLNLDGVYVGRMEFELNGVQYDLADFIEEDPNGIGDEFQTEAELVAHIQNVALPALIAANPDVPALEDVVVSLGGIWRDDDLNRPGFEIELTVPAENTLSVRDAWLQILQAEDPDQVLPPEYGSNRIERVGVIEPEEITDLSINIDLEKVGRGEDGGGLVVGGDNYTKGFDTFNVHVKGDSDKPSSLAYLLSTPHNSLSDINITTHEDFKDDENGQADLTIGNSNTPVYSILDVHNFDASEFMGTLKLYYAAIEASGVYDYKLGNTTGDTLSMHVFDNALFTAASGLTIDAGNGDNTVHVDYLNSNGSLGVNTDITSGTGDDTIVLSNMEGRIHPDYLGQAAGRDLVYPLDPTALEWLIETIPGGDTADAARVQTGAGDDAIFLNGHAVYCDADTTSYAITADISELLSDEWLTSIGLTNVHPWWSVDNWAPAGNVFPFFDSQIRVTFAGIESDWVSINSDNFMTSNQDIVTAIKQAVEGNTHLDHLLEVNDNAPGGGALINVVSGGRFNAGDLSFEIQGPNAALSEYDWNDADYDPQDGDLDWLYFPGLDEGGIDQITAQQLLNAWKTYYPLSNVSITDGDDVSWESGEVLSNFFGQPEDMTDFLDAVQRNAFIAQQLLNQSMDVNVGDWESAGIQYVNAGAGDDTIVLPHHGITFVEFTDDFFDTTTIVLPDENNLGNLRLDFTSYLDTDAVMRGQSVNDTLGEGDNVQDGFVPIPVLSVANIVLENVGVDISGIETAAEWNSDIGGGQHNSITYFNFSDIWNLLEDVDDEDVSFDPPASFADFNADELESALNYWLVEEGSIRSAEDYEHFIFDPLGDLGFDEDVSVLGAKFLILVGKDGEVIQDYRALAGDEVYPDEYDDWSIDSEYATGEMKVFTGEVVEGATDDDPDLVFGNVQELGIVHLAESDFDFDNFVGDNLFDAFL